VAEWPAPGKTKAARILGLRSCKKRRCLIGYHRPGTPGGSVPESAQEMPYAFCLPPASKHRHF
jgi:hypothetical protein